MTAAIIDVDHETAQAWAAASPDSRQTALAAGGLCDFSGIEFSLSELASLPTLAEVQASVPAGQMSLDALRTLLLSDKGQCRPDAGSKDARGAGPLDRNYWARFAAPSISAPVITRAELDAARMTPTCIVDRLLYADVGCLIAPGGVGKTTLMLHVAENIVLGLDVLGEAVKKPGRVLILTAEDSREILVARLRACMDGLTDADRARVLDGVRIADVSGLGVKLTDVVADTVMPSETTLDALIELGKEIQPVLIVIDPAVSFGVGESRVNDAEQGLVEAARRLRNDLNCCVLYVHHSGKANARERTLDQYSGRGGSAFADGSRMVLVLQNLPASEFESATGHRLGEEETGLILARPKMSYCPPPGDIYIRRTGFAFSRVEPAPSSKTARTKDAAEQVFLLIRHELKEGRRHSKNTLEHADAGDLTRAELRAGLAWLEAEGRIEFRDGPQDGKKRGPKQYIHPVDTSPKQPGEVIQLLPKKEPVTSPSESPNNFAAAYREIPSAAKFPPSGNSPFPYFAGNAWRGFGEVGEVCHLADAPARAGDHVTVEI